MALTVAVAAAGGALAYWARIPLPWVLGAMAAVALLRLAGVGASQPMPWRRVAQIAIGASLGLTFTQTVIAQIASLGFWLVLGALFAVLLTVTFAPVMRRLGGLDKPTAVYAVAVGASAEMTLQAQRAGADAALVASAHAVRIIWVVSLASVIAQWSGEHGTNYLSTATAPLPWAFGALFLVLAPAAAWLANRIHLPNGWLLGPVIMAGAFAAYGLNAKMYAPVVIGAQVLIGWSLGQHMTRQFFIKSPRLLLAATFVTLAMLTICLALAWGLSRVAGVSLLTAFLSLAPGGTAEMAIVANNFGIGAPIVTTFHFFRVMTMIVAMKWIAEFSLRR